jgi:hypothetical protein
VCCKTPPSRSPSGGRRTGRPVASGCGGQVDPPSVVGWGPGRWALGLRRGHGSRTGRAASGAVGRRARTGSPAAAWAHGGADVGFPPGTTGDDWRIEASSPAARGQGHTEKMAGRPMTGSHLGDDRSPSDRVAPRKKAGRPETGCPPAPPRTEGVRVAASVAARVVVRQSTTPGGRGGTGSDPRGWAAGRCQGHLRSRGRPCELWRHLGTRRGRRGSHDRPQVRIANAISSRWNLGRPAAEWAAAAAARSTWAWGPGGRRRGPLAVPRPL